MNTKPVAMIASAALLSISLAPATFGDGARSSLSKDFHLTPSVPLAVSDANLVPGEVLVRLKPGASKASAALEAEFDLTPVGRLDRFDVTRYSLSAPGGEDEVARRLGERPEVLYAEPNYLRHLSTVPNDYFYQNFEGVQTDLQRWTYLSVNAESAWSFTTGRPDVTIAVVDSGVALWYDDVRANQWVNTREVPNNGRDDDGNGYPDDVYGWDFYANDPDPSTDLGNGWDDDGDGRADNGNYHGTFVATCAAARGNNGGGVCGAAWNCAVMPLKVFGDEGGAAVSDVAAAIVYAADNGADVINLSLGSLTPSQTERSAVEYALARQCVVVAAAGNENIAQPGYPASFDGVLSVGASDHGFYNGYAVREYGYPNPNGRAPYSQFGPGAVDVVAPGTVLGTVVATVADSYSTSYRPGDLYVDVKPGTSFASPIVAGLAALVMSRDKDLNSGARTLGAAQIVDLIQRTARDLPDDPYDSPNAGPSWDGYGRVDFYAAVSAVTRTALAAPTGLFAAGIKRKRCDLFWSDQSDGETGFAVAYWNGAAWQDFATVPAGFTSIRVRKLIPGTTYVFAVRAFNGSGSSVYSAPLTVRSRP
jgi:hypothetical protein